jgi:hypothetical protein
MSQENPISKQPLIRHVNRQQMSWRAVDVEQLISEDHSHLDTGRAPKPERLLSSYREQHGGRGAAGD